LEILAMPIGFAGMNASLYAGTNITWRQIRPAKITILLARDLAVDARTHQHLH
jgi:hypothetical protein